MAQSRVQVDTRLSDGPRLRTQARPVDTYMGGAGSAPADTPMMRLAQSLASIRPELQQHLRQQQAEYELAEAERAYDAFQGMTFDEAKKLVETGRLEQTENPWFQAAFKKQFGLSYAGRRRREIADAYNNSFDKHGGDLDEFLAGFAREDFERFGTDKHIAAGLREGMAGLFDSIRDQHQEWKSDTTRATVHDQFLGVARLQADRAVEQGEDPSAAVRSIYGQHREMLGLTYAEMDELVMQLAGEFAEAGDYETVEALLTTEIVGEDGTPVGSFVNRAKYGTKARTYLDIARANQGERLREQNSDFFIDTAFRAEAGQLNDRDLEQLRTMRDSEQITLSQYESLVTRNKAAIEEQRVKAHIAATEAEYRNQMAQLVAEGRGYAVRDVTFIGLDGKEYTIRADEVIQQEVTRTLDRMALGGATPKEQAAVLSNMAVDAVYEPWRNLLNSGHRAAHAALLRDGPDGVAELPEAAANGFQLWRELEAFPQVRNHVIQNPEAKQVYETAEALVRVGYEEREAMLLAASVDRNVSRTGIASSLDREQLQTAVSGALKTLFSSRPANGGYVADTIEHTARVLMDTGRLSAREAVEQATIMFNNSHAKINGVAVNTRNHFIPPHFEEAATTAIRAYAEQNDVDPDELTLVPALNGEEYWIVVYRDMLHMPHENWIDGGGRLHITQILQAYDDARLADINQQIEVGPPPAADPAAERRDRINPLGAHR